MELGGSMSDVNGAKPNQRSDAHCLKINQNVSILMFIKPKIISNWFSKHTQCFGQKWDFSLPSNLLNESNHRYFVSVWRMHFSQISFQLHFVTVFVNRCGRLLCKIGMSKRSKREGHPVPRILTILPRLC